jgi:hypothetical protein
MKANVTKPVLVLSVKVKVLPNVAHISLTHKATPQIDS